MPIKAYLDGHTFDGETIRQMGIAFELAPASLRAAPDCNDPIRAALAQRIIALAKAGERSRAALRGCLAGSALLVYPEGPTLRRAAQPPRPDRRLSRLE